MQVFKFNKVYEYTCIDYINVCLFVEHTVGAKVGEVEGALYIPSQAVHVFLQIL